MIGAGRMGFMGSAYYDITDLNKLTAINAQSFAYLTMPGGPRTMQNYLASFGVTAASLNTNDTNWKNSFSGNLFFEAIPIANNNYFSEYGRVRVIEGDGTTDGPDRTVFNFGQPNGGGSFGARRGLFMAGHAVLCGAFLHGTAGQECVPGATQRVSDHAGDALLYVRHHDSGSNFDRDQRIEIGRAHV